jgi:hypothetical protein
MRGAVVVALVAIVGCAPPPNDETDATQAEPARAERATSSVASPPEQPDDRPGGARAFDFLFGQWDVHNRYLPDRLVDSDEWAEWTGSLSVMPILGGYGNVDRYLATPNGRPLEGYSIRVFDPEADAWSIHWVDSRGFRLTPQVQGSMGPNNGTFYGEEEFDGRTVRMRFTWSHDSPDRARWEQAYQRNDGTWETNWTMDFTRR